MTDELTDDVAATIAAAADALTRPRFHTHCGEIHKPGPCIDGITRPEPDVVTVRKIGYEIPISREMAMDYGLIPDDRPAPPPPTRRQRFHRWRQARLRRTRMRLASWLAGFDVEDSW